VYRLTREPLELHNRAATQAQDVLHRHACATQLDRQRECEIHEHRERHFRPARNAGAKFGEIGTLTCATACECVDVCLIHELSSMEDGRGSALSGSRTRTASLRPTRPAAVLNRG